MKPYFFLFAVIFAATACAPPPQTLALQCITGSAEWNPMVVDFAQPSVGGHPAIVTDDSVRWQTTTRNGFGGATHTQYGISRGSGTVTVENTYTDPNGIRAAEPTNHYSGECHVRPRPF